MTIVLLKAWTNDEYIEPRADFAVVDITPEHAQRILERMDAIEAAYKDDGSFFFASWWSYTPDWYEWDEEIDGVLNLGETVVLPGRPPITSEIVEQDVTCMRVYPAQGNNEAEIRWVGHIKHTAVQMETATIGRSALEKTAGGTQ